MGLKDRTPHLSLPASADWPVRIFYGLVTAYQGLFGLCVSNSIFYVAIEHHPWAAAIIGCLLIAGSLLIVDGVLGILRYCTRLDCTTCAWPMKIFHRWRHLMFLPPAFCYYLTLISVSHDMRPVHPVVYAYYIMLALAGLLFCLRDAMISNRCNRGGR